MKSIVLLITILANITLINSVQQPPSMMKQPRHEYLYQVQTDSKENVRKPFSLECEASGKPEPKYSWTKNGQPFNFAAYDNRIQQQPRSGTLVFNKPDPIDEGLYQCFAQNSLGTSMSNAVYLRQSELKSFNNEDQVIVKPVVEGQTLSIDCDPPTGYPKPFVFWVIVNQFKSLSSINSSRLTVDPDGKLHFSNVTMEDQLDEGSMYSCSVTTSFRSEYKIGAKYHLNVTGGSVELSRKPEPMYVSPNQVSALRGEDFSLYCIFGGTPLPDITWTRGPDNDPVNGNKYTQLNFGKTLRINNVDFDDEGTYQCQASNGLGSSSHSTELKVLAAPFWKNVAEKRDAAEGETVTFECDASGVPEPRLQWFWNARPIDLAPYNPRRQINGNVMTLSNLIKDDTAVYQCNASNAYGYAYKDFYINVLSLPPGFTEKPAELTQTVATHWVELKCRVYGAPLPEVKWLKDGKELSGEFTRAKNGSLIIQHAQHNHAGEYTCRASNNLGNIEARGVLKVKSKTEITWSPTNIKAAAGKDAIFKCEAQADSTLNLEIYWLFKDRKIDISQNQRMFIVQPNSLLVSKTKEPDSGNYTCVAKTELDEARATASLIVEDVPKAPQITKITCSNYTAHIEWKPTGDNGSPIISYKIQFNTSFTPNKWDDYMQNFDGQTTSIRVSTSPWANYTFIVSARNAIGLGPPSAPSAVCSTNENVPYDNPKHVTGRGDRPDNMIISWTRMKQIEHNAPGFYYKVYWREYDNDKDSWHTEIITDWRKDRFEVVGLPTFRKYWIKVEAHNRRGQSASQASRVIGYSGEDVPTMAPKNFRQIGSAEAKSALFSWDPVPESSLRGHFLGYKIQVWLPTDDERDAQEVPVLPNVTSHRINILKPNWDNIVQVRAYNGLRKGPPSDRLIVRTPEGEPGPVSDLRAYPAGKSGFFIVWNQPEELNGVLLGYKLLFDVMNKTYKHDGGQISNIPPEKTVYKLSGLNTDTLYRLTIVPYNNAGDGQKYFIEKKTRSNVDMMPDRPEFTLQKIDSKEDEPMVKVIWQPPIEDGRAGSHFFVQYKKKGDSAFQSLPPVLQNNSYDISGLEPDTKYEIRVISVDGDEQTESQTKDFFTGRLYESFGDPGIAGVDWLIGALCAIALVIILALLVCIVKRNRGGKYSVHEHEAKQGYIEYGDDVPFDEYSKPLGGAIGSSLASLRHADGNDTDSMTDGEDDSAKFGEDGSFIGQYGAKTKKTSAATPSGVATFV